mmetsp:Transcript_29929/g.42066  ORF Transcript_29929/g.42066 Transcript_29929/m.42066 type:complete len:351 (-) Transcript_29929:67-1119(-)
MKATLFICLIGMLAFCQAHIKMNSLNGVAASNTSRNAGAYSVENANDCGGTTAVVVGANGYTTIWPGQPLDLVWEMNDHAAKPSFRIAFSPDGNATKFNSNVLVSNIPHNGAGVYKRSITAPRELCSKCTIQVLHAGYDWAGCFDLKIVKAPCGGDCATTGVVENGKLDYKSGEVTCNSGYKKTSDNTCVSTGMSPAGAFFLSIFVILVVCIIAFAILVALRRTGHLPEGVGKVVEKGEKLTASAFTKTKNGVVFLAGKVTGSSSSSSNANNNASPSATEAQTQQTAQPTPAPSNASGFSKGMQCQAKYTGDGQYYKAFIKDVNTHTNQYLVSYPEYGTDEWLPVTSLKK